MRTNNSKIKNVIISVYFVLVILAIFSAFVFSSFRHLTPNPFLTFLLIASVFIGIFLIVHRISRYFEYDSDGTNVVMINRGLMLTDHINYREKKVEFEKDKFVAYKFHNYLFYRTLDIYLKDRKSGKRKESFNITFLPKKKRGYIRQSLNKMAKANAIA